MNKEKEQRLRKRAEEHLKSKRKNRSKTKTLFKHQKKHVASAFLTRGLYFLIKNNIVVYVGLSKDNCLARISKHYADKIKDFESFKITPLENYSDKQLEGKERDYIKAMKPLYNIRHNESKTRSKRTNRSNA